MIYSRLPLIYLARHGETEWSISGQHTGMTDIPLTSRGESNARSLGQRLNGLTFDVVLTSPLVRAAKTCELAGFGSVAQTDDDLVEWNYGEFEGQTTKAIRAQRPDWDIFRDGCPDGETLAEIAIRANRVIQRIRAAGETVLIFSHSHFLHLFAACWLGLPPQTGRHFFLDAGALSILGYHHDLNDPVVRLWNDCA